MAKYEVEVSRTITVTVPVEADSPEQAHETASKANFPLPPRDQWTGGKDWRFVVYDDDGNELGRDESDGSGYVSDDE